MGIARSRHQPRAVIRTGGQKAYALREAGTFVLSPVYPKDRKGFPLDSSHDPAREYDSGYAFWLQVSRSLGQRKNSKYPKPKEERL